MYQKHNIFLPIPRMMSSSTSFFFFLPPEDGKTRNHYSMLPKSSNASHEPQIKPLQSNSNYNKYRKENLLEHGLEHWRTRRKQRRRENGRGENGSQSEIGVSFRKQYLFNQLWTSFICFLMVRNFNLLYLLSLNKFSIVSNTNTRFNNDNKCLCQPFDILYLIPHFCVDFPL